MMKFDYSEKTYAEYLQDCLNKLPREDNDELDIHIDEHYSIVFETFIRSMATLLALMAQHELSIEALAGKIQNGDEVVCEDDGKPIENPSIDDFINLLHSLTMRGIGFSLKYMKFVHWLLDHKVPDWELDEDNYVCPYETDTLVNLYNEFAMQENERM